MKFDWWTWLLVAVISLLFGYIGAELAESRSGGGSTDSTVAGVTDSVISRELSLSDEERRQINAIQQRYHARAQELRVQLNQANQLFYDALREESSLGSRSQQARVRLWDIFSQLQTLTFDYVIEVRTVLSPKQRQYLDSRVQTLLTSR